MRGYASTVGMVACSSRGNREAVLSVFDSRCIYQSPVVTVATFRHRDSELGRNWGPFHFLIYQGQHQVFACSECDVMRLRQFTSCCFRRKAPDLLTSFAKIVDSKSKFIQTEVIIVFVHSCSTVACPCPHPLNLRVDSPSLPASKYMNKFVTSWHAVPQAPSRKCSALASIDP
jgi:hypothetical protein